MGHPRQGESVSLDLLSNDLSGGAYVILRDANMQVRTLLPTERFILDMLEAQVASGIAVDVELIGPVLTPISPLLDLPFNEGTGTTDTNIGSLGSSNNATLSSAAWGPPLGYQPYSLNCNATDYAYCTATGLPAGTNPWTFAIWFLTSIIPSGDGYITQYGNQVGGGEVNMFMQPDGTIFLGFGEAGGFGTSIPYADGMPHFLRVNTDGVTVTGFIDEVQFGTAAPASFSILFASNQLPIGASIGDIPTWTGLLGETFVYGANLTAAQGALLFAGQTVFPDYTIEPLPNSLLASFYPGVGFMEVPSEGMSLPPNQVPFAIASGAGTVHLVGSGRIVQDCQQMGRPSWQANLNP
jgi:hypothetical protein